MILASPSGSSFGMSIHKLRKSYCRGDTFATFQQTNVLGETVAPTRYLGRVSDSVTQQNIERNVGYAIETLIIL